MASEERSRLFARLAREAGVLATVWPSARVRDAFDCAFETVQRSGQRDEYLYGSGQAHPVGPAQPQHRLHC